MKQSRFSRILFALLGCCSLAMSLVLGCTFSGQSDSVRIESPGRETGDRYPTYPP